MGKRRIRNFLKLGYSDIIGFDIRKDRRIETMNKYGIKTFSQLDEALDKKPKLMIISTSPDLHLKYAKIAIEKKINFFTELNMFSKDIEQIIHKMHGKSIVGLPSCTLRFHPVIKKVKELLENNAIGNVLLIHQHIGQYLPNWHPWEDYRKFFVSKRETGGARELLPFELFWLTYLFSDIKSVYAKMNKVSKLDADIDDFYLYNEFDMFGKIEGRIKIVRLENNYGNSSTYKDIIAYINYSDESCAKNAYDNKTSEKYVISYSVIEIKLIAGKYYSN